MDSRGNKSGVDAQFSVCEEKVAWLANHENGEEDFLTIYANPNEKKLQYMRKSKNRNDLWNNLLYSDGLSIKDQFGLV